MTDEDQEKTIRVTRNDLTDVLMDLVALIEGEQVEDERLYYKVALVATSQFNRFWREQNG